jgi:hypothetical protein
MEGLPEWPKYGPSLSHQMGLMGMEETIDDFYRKRSDSNEAFFHY